jgi:hypothetical protein
MGYKKERLGPRIVAGARSRDRYRDVHVFFGGTGAVGGTALLKMLAIYEEMFSISPPDPEDVPVLVATAATPEEIAGFTSRLFRFTEARYGRPWLPERERRGSTSGYLLPSGIFVALERFSVSVLQGLAGIGKAGPEDRGPMVEELMASIGASAAGPAGAAFAALERAVAAQRPFGRFLHRYADEHLRERGIGRFRSVVVGIPIPSVVAYHTRELSMAAEHVAWLPPERLTALKDRFLETLVADLVEARRDLADEVLVAHTTGTGGMYDELPEGAGRQVRMAFAHAAQDRNLAEKQRVAERFTEAYREAGLKTLVTAAAIGVDEVKVRSRVPLHREVADRLSSAAEEVFPGSKQLTVDQRATREAGQRVMVRARQMIRVFPPLTVPFDGPQAAVDRARPPFERGEELVPTYCVRSGENGFFSVANAEALYRTMRVASASELGLVLARVGMFGDDPLAPWFPDGVCYYTETDNSRQVLDFLAQPALRQMQLSGLEPMALQDLGSSKHQAELHTLGLLILLHRLRTLDVDAIESYVDPATFDARAFFLQHSRVLTFEDVVTWEVGKLGADLQVLAGAVSADDLLPLTPPRELDLFRGRREALRAVLDTVARAVWFGPSLGSPILFEQGGRTFLRTGYYVAPLDLLVTHPGDVGEHLRRAHLESGNPCTFEDYRDYHVSVGGFVDVRPHAILCSARSDREDLTGRVVRAGGEDALRKAIQSLEPYSFFSMAGLVAVMYRLRALYRLLREAMLELGTLQELSWQMPRDASGHLVVVPGIVEAMRMVAEGLEKTTGTEPLDGLWGYERRAVPDRRGIIPGFGRRS